MLVLHPPHVRDFAGFDRPWARLADLVPDLAVRELAMGAGSVADGRLPRQPGGVRYLMNRAGLPATTA